MRSRKAIRTRRGRVLIPFAAAVVTAYFGFHAVNGAHGLVARDGLIAREAALEAELAALTARREALERRIALLGDAAIDPDLLEERARELLNFAHPDELVIWRGAAR